MEGYDKFFKRLLGHDIFNYAVPNNHITDPSDEGKKYDHPNCAVEFQMLKALKKI